MKRKNKTLTLTLIIAASIILILIIQAPLNKQKIPTRFIAGEVMGFDLGPGNINFGQIVPGYSASRAMTIANIYDHPILITIESSGEISEYIIVSKNNFILQPNESKEITFSCYTEKGIELREYPGQIIIITNKA